MPFNGADSILLGGDGRVKPLPFRESVLLGAEI